MKKLLFILATMLYVNVCFAYYDPPTFKAGNVNVVGIPKYARDYVGNYYVITVKGKDYRVGYIGELSEQVKKCFEYAMENDQKVQFVGKYINEKYIDSSNKINYYSTLDSESAYCKVR